MSNNKIRREFFKFSFLLPALIIFTIIVVVPFFKGILYSFTNWDGVSKSYSYVGLNNYLHLFSDEYILADTGHTLIFTLLQTISCNMLGLLLALGVKKSGRLTNFLRAVYFMPFVLSIVLASFIFTFIFHNVGYDLLHIMNPLSDKGTVLSGIALIALWRDSGYAMVIYLASLQAIPDSYYEAADVDGAKALKKFFHITLPLIVPAFTINLTMFIGWGLKTFDYVYVSTGGGPGRSSETLAQLVYMYTFPYNRASFGQAAALVMFVMIALITGIIARVFRKKEVEV
jgi:raffinose/stachyose/melibiose transport system permease protein